MTPKQRKNNGNSLVNRYTRTEPESAVLLADRYLHLASTMASDELIQEGDGEYRHGKAVMVKGVRMPHVYAYLTGFAEFINNFITKNDDVFIVGFPRLAYWGSWAEHVLEWWKHKDDENVLFLKYEDMKRDLPSQIGLISKFLSKSLSEDMVDRIAKQCTFDAMKNNSSAYWMMTRDGELPNFLRKGQVGGWKDYFTPELIRRMNESRRKLLSKGMARRMFD
ncbi:Amine sulfotransferase [Stylophora pistillata]|uniref:Amine sulfotransferase n=1 Tax=Stylophora pistillata TaxID=50429 RepID=A0A2B4SQ85_STYPI|nr:Amine sulfotransferase [Stylophora pistillata]